MRKEKQEHRLKKKQSIRKKVAGTLERPRLCVFRSLQHVYVQAIDDSTHATLVAVASTEKAIRPALQNLEKRAAAKWIGQEMAKRCLEKGIQKVVFDRNGFLYHGRVSYVAEGAREGGLQF